MTIEKNREDRLLAAKAGYHMVKSRCRNPNRPEYGGFMLIDNAIGGAVVGGGEPYPYNASLYEIEVFLKWSYPKCEK
jgi:hypothetical protein